MNRFNDLMLIVVIIVTTVSPMDAFAADDTSRKPNVVLIYTDDLGYGDVGC